MRVHFSLYTPPPPRSHANRIPKTISQKRTMARIYEQVIENYYDVISQWSNIYVNV